MIFKRIHLILLVLVLALGGAAFWQYFRRTIAKNHEAERLVQEETRRKQAEEESRKKLNSEEKQSLARQAIAVAGEMILQSKKKGFDVSGPQAALRQAKLAAESGDFHQAYTLAHQSIDQLAAVPESGQRYVVRRGDTLWAISKMRVHYGRGAGWVKIWRANEQSVPDFDLIEVGQELNIPPR